jgi:putative ABC transport system permease protein
MNKKFESYWFQFVESSKIALESLRTNKLRSSLTLLGIAIGLFSIIIVMTSLSAIQKSVEDTFSAIGKNNFFVQKMPAVRIGGPGSWRKYRHRKDITIEDAKRLKKMTHLPLAVGVWDGKGGRVVKYNGERTNPDVGLRAADFDALQVEEIEIAQGRSLNKQDIALGRSVCVIGSDVNEKLFHGMDPIGQKIKVDRFNLTVIGVAKKRGSVLGNSQDNYVVIPLPLFTRVYGKNRNVTISIRARDNQSFEATKEEVIGAMRIIRKVPPGKDNDFEIITYDQLISQFNDLTKYFKLGAAVVAFIALIAAGIGIMNIMLVSVTERTREIGIRKAIGAKKAIIRAQFVTEAIVLSWVGGLAGIVLGIIGGNIVALVLGVSVVLPLDWIVIGFLVTTFVGVLFGVYPAVKASNLDPIEALRYE